MTSDPAEVLIIRQAWRSTEAFTKWTEASAIARAT